MFSHESYLLQVKVHGLDEHELLQCFAIILTVRRIFICVQLSSGRESECTVINNESLVDH